VDLGKKVTLGIIFKDVTENIKRIIKEAL